MDGLTISLYVTAGVVIFPGIFINSGIIYFIATKRKLQTRNNILIANLAVSDLFTFLIMIGFLSYILLPDLVISSKVNAYLFPSLDVFSASACSMNLMFVSIDRAISICYPFRYESMISTSRVNWFIATAWIYSVFMFTLAMIRIEVGTELYENAFVYGAIVVSYVIPLVVIMVCYFRIACSAVKGLAMMRNSEKETIRIMSSDEKAKARRKEMQMKRWKRELKTTINIVVILGPYMFGWGVFFGVHLYELGSGIFVENEILDWILCVIPWVNSAASPLTYTLLSKDLRKAFLASACKKSPRNLQLTHL